MFRFLPIRPRNPRLLLGPRILWDGQSASRVTQDRLSTPQAPRHRCMLLILPARSSRPGTARIAFKLARYKPRDLPGVQMDTSDTSPKAEGVHQRSGERGDSSPAQPVTIFRTPNPDCPSCIRHRRHSPEEWKRFHPDAGQSYQKGVA